MTDHGNGVTSSIDGPKKSYRLILIIAGICGAGMLMMCVCCGGVMFIGSSQIQAERKAYEEANSLWNAGEKEKAVTQYRRLADQTHFGEDERAQMMCRVVEYEVANGNMAVARQRTEEALDEGLRLLTDDEETNQLIAGIQAEREQREAEKKAREEEERKRKEALELAERKAQQAEKERKELERQLAEEEARRKAAEREKEDMERRNPDRDTSRKPAATGGSSKRDREYAVGDEFQLGNYKYRVTGVTNQRAIGEVIFDEFMGEKASEGATFLIVSYTIENCTNETQTVLTDDFTVIDARGRKYSPSSDANVALLTEDDKDFLLSEIQPGIPRKMKTAFEVPISSLDGEMVLVIPKKGLLSMGEARVRIEN